MVSHIYNSFTTYKRAYILFTHLLRKICQGKVPQHILLAGVCSLDRCIPEGRKHHWRKVMPHHEGWDKDLWELLGLAPSELPFTHTALQPDNMDERPNVRDSLTRSKLQIWGPLNQKEQWGKMKKNWVTCFNTFYRLKHYRSLYLSPKHDKFYLRSENKKLKISRNHVQWCWARER